VAIDVTLPATPYNPSRGNRAEETNSAVKKAIEASFKG
jgi:hypothetical protein